MCSSDISLDESFDNLDEATSDTMSLQNLDLQTSLNSSSNSNNSTNNNHTSASLVNHNNNNINGLMPGTNITHIDKLYLMQNSYFNGTSIEQWSEWLWTIDKALRNQFVINCDYEQLSQPSVWESNPMLCRFHDRKWELYF